jgi:signal transduction histidine kinase/CheY-like chemotaxis protein
VCPTLDALVGQLRLGAAAALVPEEALAADNSALLGQALAEQPPWSDVPLLVLTRPGADSEAAAEAVRTLGNVTLLERPLRVATLLSAIRTALRARYRQYEVRRLLRQRSKAEEALRAADRRKDEFLATLGHELRNPLAPVVTGLHLLRLARVDDAVVRQVTSVLERQVGHLVRLVDDLLEVSRITRGLVEVRREPLHLAAVLRSALETSRPSIDAGGHELAVDITSDPLPVTGDAVRLTQVFANLLTNAAKYTDRGGKIRLTAARDGSRAVVSVRDTGIGIPLSELASVFDMFTQLDGTHRRAQGGLGIGLTLVRSLVTMHGGRVEARSEGAGKGSEFVVELPLSAVEPTDQEPAKPVARFPALRILVVDDNVDAGDTLAALLTALGSSVSVARSGRAALAALRVFRPDVVLMDIGMPEMDGYEVARSIRAMPDHDDVLLVALSGWGQADDQRRSRGAGFDHHLVKPLEIEQLRRVLVAGAREPDPPRH